jgi:hypothetical protein
VDTSCRMPWSAGYITNMFESEFSAHTVDDGCCRCREGAQHRIDDQRLAARGGLTSR